MNKGCVLINKDCTAELIGIEEFNNKFGKIKSKMKSEFVLIPVSSCSEAYIAIPTVNLPDKFSLMKIEYELGIITISGKYNIWDMDTYKRDFKSKYSVECKTLYDLYIFAFSLKKLMAFNVLNNMNEIKHNPYVEYLTTTVLQPYIFDIKSFKITYAGEVTEFSENVSGIEKVLDVISTLIGVKSIIVPNIYKFWIGSKHRCNYTPCENHRKMIGTINKITESCIMSTQCINYDAYSFISTEDEVLLKSIPCTGELLMVNYTLMCDPEDLPIDGPITVMEMLKHPDVISVYRIERYNLYTISDCVEALTFAVDLLNMMDTTKKLIGGDESMSESMLEIRLDGYDFFDDNMNSVPLSYTVTKESVDFGEITNVVSDFMNRLDAFLNEHLPF